MCTQVWLNGQKTSTSALHKSPALRISFNGWLVGSQLLRHQPESHPVPLKMAALCTSQNTHMTSDCRQKPMKLAPDGNIIHQVIPGFSPDCSTGSSEFCCIDAQTHWWSDWLQAKIISFWFLQHTWTHPLPATTASTPVLRPTHPAVKGAFYGA